MNRVEPSAALCTLIVPYHPVTGGRRRTVLLERLLRIHFLRQRPTRFDPGADEALYDSVPFAHFAGVANASKLADVQAVSGFERSG